MAYKLVIACAKTWERDLSLLSAKSIATLNKKIQELSEEPWPGFVQVKKLHHFKLADFRLRVGNYRVLFILHRETKTIELLRVLHRGKLY